MNVYPDRRSPDIKLRRMVSGVLTIPAEFEFPSNVRIIGTINIDQTTHYFAPKVLDRAYLLKFESPLNRVALVEEEVFTRRDTDRLRLKHSLSTNTAFIIDQYYLAIQIAHCATDIGQHQRAVHMRIDHLNYRRLSA